MLVYFVQQNAKLNQNVVVGVNNKNLFLTLYMELNCASHALARRNKQLNMI